MSAAPVHEELARAVQARDLEAVRRYVAANPSARDLIDRPMFPFDAPAIVHFANAQDLEMVGLLLELGADPNRRSDWWAGGFHALHSARGEVAERLLEGGAVVDACAAANLDRPDLLRELLDEDAGRVHERGGDGQTPLHFARSRTVVDLLLDRGADLDARDVDHRATAAEWMLQGRRGAGRYALAEYLVDRGASTDIFLACALGRTQRVRELVAADPSVLNLRTGRGAYGEQPPSSFHMYTWSIGQHLSPLQVAARFEHEAVLDVLRAVASRRDRFLAACSDGRGDEARELLLERPALVAELTPDEMRALPDAAWAGRAAAVELMLSLGFDATVGGQDGGTVLHCGAWHGRVDCVRVALEHDSVRALIEVRDPTHGSTPLGWCCHGARFSGNRDGDHPEVARILLAAGAVPGPNLDVAPDDVRAVIDGFGGAGAG